MNVIVNKVACTLVRAKYFSQSFSSPLKKFLRAPLIAVASCVQVVLGFTGASGLLLRFIGPLTTSTTIALIGLDLFTVTYTYAEVQWGIALR